MRAPPPPPTPPYEGGDKGVVPYTFLNDPSANPVPNHRVMKIDLKHLTISALVCTFFGHVQAANIVGQVDDFNCFPDVYSLTRDGKKMAVKFFTQLREGDQVAINTDKNTLSLDLSYEGSIGVHYKTPSYKFDKALPLSVKLTNAACPPDDAYSFKRDGKILPIQPTLLVGDQIVVNKATPTIHLKLGDNEVVKVNYENSPYTVKSKGKVSSTRSNLWAWLKQVVTDWHEEEIQTTLVTVSTKGVGDAPPDISAPYTHLLKEYSYRNLVAGTRALYFAWGGGKAPYELTIKSAGKALLILKGVQKKRVKTQNFSLTVGNYDLQIKDADNRTANYLFTVVNSKPAYPKELLETSVSEATRLTAQATWLAAQKKKKWVFEAYQQIAELAERYPAARVVRHALEQRARIPKLPKK